MPLEYNLHGTNSKLIYRSPTEDQDDSGDETSIWDMDVQSADDETDGTHHQNSIYAEISSPKTLNSPVCRDISQ